MKPKGAIKHAKHLTSKPHPPGYIPKKQLTLFSTVDVCRNVGRFMEGAGKSKGRKPDERYASFDYCFNYFRSFYEQHRVADICRPENVQLSCLHLACYLASWGMLRNSFLGNKSVRFYKLLLERIVQLGERPWRVDVDSYTDENVELLLETGKAIREALGDGNKPSPTLVTKVMLGVYGNVPAFDRYVRKSARDTWVHAEEPEGRVGVLRIPQGSDRPLSKGDPHP